MIRKNPNNNLAFIRIQILKRKEEEQAIEIYI